MFLMLVGVNSRTYYKQTPVSPYNDVPAHPSDCINQCKTLGTNWVVIPDVNGCKDYFVTIGLMTEIGRNDVNVDQYDQDVSNKLCGGSCKKQCRLSRVSSQTRWNEVDPNRDEQPTTPTQNVHAVKNSVSACICKKICHNTEYLNEFGICASCNGMIEAAYIDENIEVQDDTMITTLGGGRYVPEKCVTKDELKERYNELQVCRL